MVPTPVQATMNMATVANEILGKINELAAQVANGLGLTVINTRLTGQGKQKNLEICIYRPEISISFADCEAMSRNFEQILEQEEAKDSTLINGPFTIEVISPGIERRLTTATDFALFAGKPVRIVAKEKIGVLGTEFIAVLTGGDEHSIIVSQAEPKAGGLTAAPTKKSGKKKSAKIELSDETGNELTLALSQVYGIYLYPRV